MKMTIMKPMMRLMGLMKHDERLRERENERVRERAKDNETQK